MNSVGNVLPMAPHFMGTTIGRGDLSAESLLTLRSRLGEGERVRSRRLASTNSSERVAKSALLRAPMQRRRVRRSRSIRPRPRSRTTVGARFATSSPVPRLESLATGPLVLPQRPGDPWRTPLALGSMQARGLRPEGERDEQQPVRWGGHGIFRSAVRFPLLRPRVACGRAAGKLVSTIRASAAVRLKATAFALCAPAGAV